VAKAHQSADSNVCAVKLTVADRTLNNKHRMPCSDAYIRSSVVKLLQVVLLCEYLSFFRILKCPLPLNFFVSRQMILLFLIILVKRIIIVSCYFLNFLWIFKVLKIHVTVWFVTSTGELIFAKRDAERPNRRRRSCLEYAQWVCCCQ